MDLALHSCELDRLLIYGYSEANVLVKVKEEDIVCLCLRLDGNGFEAMKRSCWIYNKGNEGNKPTITTTYGYSTFVKGIAVLGSKTKNFFWSVNVFKDTT